MTEARQPLRSSTAGPFDGGQPGTRPTPAAIDGAGPAAPTDHAGSLAPR